MIRIRGGAGYLRECNCNHFGWLHENLSVYLAPGVFLLRGTGLSFDANPPGGEKKKKNKFVRKLRGHFPRKIAPVCDASVTLE